VPPPRGTPCSRSPCRRAAGPVYEGGRVIKSPTILVYMENHDRVRKLPSRMAPPSSFIDLAVLHRAHPAPQRLRRVLPVVRLFVALGGAVEPDRGVAVHAFV
jgi:hypothetical protein